MSVRNMAGSTANKGVPKNSAAALADHHGDLCGGDSAGNIEAKFDGDNGTSSDVYEVAGAGGLGSQKG